MIRAKFVVSELHTLAWGGSRVVLAPQYDQSIEEDRRFFKATPSGRFEMAIDNPLAVEHLKLNRAFYIDLTPVE